jgi:hypothetical protein
MNNSNFLFLPSQTHDRFIYRIIPIERLVEIFASSKNVLVKPKRWNDPFENFILHCRVQLPDGAYATFGFQDHFFAQCWTLQTASDAMWRIYSPKSNAVRIRITIKKLAESLARCCGPSAVDEVFIGRVQYLPQKKLEEFAKGILRSNSGLLSMRLFAKTLLVKRPAFRHEQEVRLIFTPHDQSKTAGDLFSYPINPNELLDQIMIDPRMDENAANNARVQIRSQTGFSGTIKRSLLYEPPPTWILPL